MFKAGDDVLICGELPRMKGRIRWQCTALCPEHGDKTYKVRYAFPNGAEYEAEMCESVLTLPNEQ